MSNPIADQISEVLSEFGISKKMLTGGSDCDSREVRRYYNQLNAMRKGPRRRIRQLKAKISRLVRRK